MENVYWLEPKQLEGTVWPTFSFMALYNFFLTVWAFHSSPFFPSYYPGQIPEEPSLASLTCLDDPCCREHCIRSPCRSLIDLPSIQPANSTLWRKDCLSFTLSNRRKHDSQVQGTEGSGPTEQERETSLWVDQCHSPSHPSLTSADLYSYQDGSCRQIHVSLWASLSFSPSLKCTYSFSKL